MDALMQAFMPTFDRLWRRAWWAAWRSGAHEPDDVAGTVMEKLWKAARRRSDGAEWVAGRLVLRWVDKAAGTTTTDHHRAATRRDSAERESFRLGREEATTREIDPTGVSREWEPSRMIPVISEKLCFLQRHSLEIEWFQCPICVAGGAAACPQSTQVAALTSAFFAAAANSLSGYATVPVSFEREISLRRVAVASGLASTALLDRSTAEAARWFRAGGMGIHLSFAVNSQAAHLGYIGRGTRRLVWQTAEGMRARLGRGWKAEYDQALGDFFDDLFMGWNSTDGPQGMPEADYDQEQDPEEDDKGL